MILDTIARSAGKRVEQKKAGKTAGTGDEGSLYMQRERRH